MYGSKACDADEAAAAAVPDFGTVPPEAVNELNLVDHWVGFKSDASTIRTFMVPLKRAMIPEQEMNEIFDVSESLLRVNFGYK